ncbi:MAG: 50S ribosomal protein L29 [Gammaproteobacteria bacterium]
MKKTPDIKQKNAEELNKELLELRREQFNLRMQKGTGQLTKPHQLKDVRHQIARIKTLLTQGQTHE